MVDISIYVYCMECGSELKVDVKRDNDLHVDICDCVESRLDEKYEEGKEKGYDEGYEEGKEKGYDEGYRDRGDDIEMELKEDIEKGKI